MNVKFTPVRLNNYFNATARLRKARKGAVGWNDAIVKNVHQMPRGQQAFQGIPFLLGPKGDARKCMVLAGGKSSEVTVPLKGRATHVCIAHFCNWMGDPLENAAGGEHIADYVVRFADGSERVQTVRRRFEINFPILGWGHQSFVAAGATKMRVPTDEDEIPWGMLQQGLAMDMVPFGPWIYALENPCPEKELREIVFRADQDALVAVLGITLYDGPGHPLRYLRRRAFKLTLPAKEKARISEVETDVDLGVVTLVAALTDKYDNEWVNAVDRGLGAPATPPDVPRREFLLDATGAEGATLTVQVPRGRKHKFALGEAYVQPCVKSADGRATVEILDPRSTWVHVCVRDAATGQLTPTRVHIAGPNGNYIPPYGHHEVVNDRWFEDYGGDLKLGRASYAYVPGSFQVELPVGEVYIELWKGFEYEPLRKKIAIRPGQRELDLEINRAINLRQSGWVTADTHVHFISPQTAWLEGQCEGLNLINLLASQWGRLFTNAADISGELSGCSKNDTLVWVGTENRNHLLGHISMLGAHGDPVFPMCAGGPGEAYIGDPDVTTLTEWAQTCREREGVVIRPHFPAPVCEEPVYFTLEQLDGAELRMFSNPDSGTLDAYCFKEWYRYLNCGYRVAAVGGTDKMSAGMPVGGVRTYAQLSPDDPFTFESWGKAVRAGRTYTTSGPLVSLTVDGRHVGDEIRMPAGGGTLEVRASAECLWPMNRLDVVVNGKVVASTSSARGSRKLEIKQNITVRGSCWIAARCGSRLIVNHCWPIPLGAHTSPVYVVAGDEELFNMADATYMLTLIDGGVTYLDTLSVRYDEKRHREMKAIFEKARAMLTNKVHQHGGSRPHVH
jgi:hypothetical protein